MESRPSSLSRRYPTLACRLHLEREQQERRVLASGETKMGPQEMAEPKQHILLAVPLEAIVMAIPIGQANASEPALPLQGVTFTIKTSGNHGQQRLQVTRSGSGN